MKSGAGKSISVYPNPVVNKTMNVQFTNQAMGTYQVQLLSQDGATVYKNEAEINSSNQVKTMKLNAGTAAGTYQLLVSDKDGNQTNSTIIIL